MLTLPRLHTVQIVAKAPPAALAATPSAPAAAQPRGQETQKDSAEKDGDVEEDEGSGGRIVDATLGVGVVFKNDRRGFYKIIEVVQVRLGETMSQYYERVIPNRSTDFAGAFARFSGWSRSP